MIWVAGGGSVVLPLLAVVGLVSYLFWRIFRSEAMQGAIAVNDESNAGWHPPIEM